MSLTREETCFTCGAWSDEPCPRRPCEYVPHSAQASLPPAGGETKVIPITDYETDEWACAAGIERFTIAMRDKLNRKRKAGRGGWNKPDECSVEYLRELMLEHMSKGDPIDIANLCMMIWNRENPTGGETKAAPQDSEQSTKSEGEAALPSSTPAGAAPNAERRQGHSAMRVKDGKIERFDPNPNAEPADMVSVPVETLKRAINAIADTEIVNVAGPYKSDFRTKDLRPLKRELEAMLAAAQPGGKK